MSAKLPPTAVAEMTVYVSSIPMRSFEHAAAARDRAEAVLVRLRLAGGGEGWGETLPRPYVTGESIESVQADLEQRVWPALAGVSLTAGAEGLVDLPAPLRPGGAIGPAACCAVEVAANDAAGFGCHQRRMLRPRVSGVLGSAESARTLKRLRLMWWFGLRDYKLKLGLGDEADRKNLRLVAGRLRRAIRRRRASLRVDVNGGWPAEDVPERTAELAAAGVCCVEQPVFAPAGELAELARRCSLPLMADESLCTPADAEALLAADAGVWWNIRISKNGGLAAALDLARRAHRQAIPYSLGCMVGETGILSAAQRRLLELAPPPRFVEGNYGLFLLSDELARPPIRFGYRGRLRPLRGPGLGVAVDPGKVARHARQAGQWSLG